jgi:hypothetical protein
VYRMLYFNRTISLKSTTFDTSNELMSPLNEVAP